jgi:tRNA-2-methylthio-N6-dimethylallyladenosine synthase
MTDSPTRSRRFFIETWGCQMNELDTQRMAGQLMQQGLLPTLEPQEADVVLLNSCSVREKAAHKAYSRLGEFRAMKREKPGLMIGFCGCVAQQEGEAAMSRLPDLDFVIGPGRVAELREILAQRAAGERVVATGFPKERIYDIDAVSRDTSHKGMVTIIEGCNKRCTFCIVPTTRGSEICRPIADVLREVQLLLDYGFAEIELLGQTVNHWREPDGDLDFADLLHQVAALPGLRRLRFVTSYPRDFTPRMIEAVGAHDVICPYVHLPVQSGSNRLLKMMGRGYEVALYEEVVAGLRSAKPGVTLSTDIIVGFPGETEEDHQETLELIERMQYGWVYAFKYSPRPHTAAPRLAVEQVPDEIASRRLQELFDLQQGIGLRHNQALVGTTMEVLVTGPGNERGQQAGRTACHRAVNFALSDEPARVGELVDVRIDTAYPYSLVGSRVESAVGAQASPR